MHHKRGDTVLARDVEMALPDELNARQRRALAIDLARSLAVRYNVAADVAMDALIRERDERNHHFHIVLSACKVTSGVFNALCPSSIFHLKTSLFNLVTK